MIRKWEEVDPERVAGIQCHRAPSVMACVEFSPVEGDGLTLRVQQSNLVASLDRGEEKADPVGSRALHGKRAEWVVVRAQTTFQGDVKAETYAVGWGAPKGFCVGVVGTG